ncbi:histidine kinase [Tolypothrix sp. VBCCA 56010]|uniref:histidine kinase n=1 Tax=Tolypothrix sp. VBCCA 56010 TaxID=3137731 RepID=UPI003D7EDC32
MGHGTKRQGDKETRRQGDKEEFIRFSMPNAQCPLPIKQLPIKQLPIAHYPLPIAH